MTSVFGILLSLFLVFGVFGAATAEVRLVVGPGVTKAQLKTIEGAMTTAQNALKKRYGFVPAVGTTVFISDDAQFLATQYVQFNGRGSVSQKQAAFENWISGEAVYRGVFINLGNAHNQNKRNLEQNVAHELFHVIQYELVGPKSRSCCDPNRVSVAGPTWLMEGSASYFHASFDRSFFRGFISHGRNNRRGMGQAGLASLETFRGTNAFQDAYPVGAYAVSLLIKQAGEASVPNYYAEIGRGAGWEDAFETAFGISSQAFYASFGQ